MGLKGFDLTRAESGIQETYHERDSLEDTGDNCLEYLVFCDGVSPEDDTGNTEPSRAAATLAEQALKDYLQKIPVDSIDEELLHNGFAYANQRLLELYGDDENSVAVSAVVMAIVDAPEQGRPGEKTLLIAGLGDSVVHSVDQESVELLFRDPQVPLVDTPLSAEERHLSLHNALGVGDQFHVHCQFYELAPFQRYLISSYGLIFQTPLDELQGMGLHPHDATQGMVAGIDRKQLNAHALRTCAVSYEGAEDPVAPFIEDTTAPTKSPSRHRERTTAVVLTAAACFLVLFTVFHLLEEEDEPETVAETPLKEDFQELAKQDTTLNELREALEASQQRAASLQEQLLSLHRPEEQRLTANREVGGNAAALSQHLRELEATLREERLVTEQLRENLHELQQRLNERERTLEATKETNIAYASRYADLENQLTAKLDDLSRSYERQRFRQGSLHEDYSDRLQELLADLELERAASQKLEAELDHLKSTQTDVTHTSSATDAQIVRLSNELQSVQEAFGQIQKRNTILKDELRTAMNEARARNGGEDLKKKLEQLTIAFQQEQKRNTDLKEDLRSALDAIGERENLVAQLKEEVKHASKVAESDLTATTQQLTTKTQLLEKEVAKGLTEIKEKEQTLQEAQYALQTAQQNQEMWTNEKDQLLADKASLMEKIEAMRSFQELYATEKHLRQRKEREFASFSQGLQEQRDLISNIENSRTTIAQELQRVKKQYTNLLHQTARAQQNRRVDRTRTAVADQHEAPTRSTTLVHIVARGDTLSGIAKRYFGMASRWVDIYEANRDRIPDKNNIRIGTTLVIPAVR